MGRFPFIRVGLIFAISPLLLAFVTSIFQGGSMWDEGIAAVPGDPVPALFLLLPLVPLCRHGTSAARSPLTPRQIQIMLMHRSSVVVILEYRFAVTSNVIHGLARWPKPMNGPSLVLMLHLRDHCLRTPQF